MTAPVVPPCWGRFLERYRSSIPWRSGVRRRPDRPHWAERGQRNEACLDVIAPGAFEQSAFETFWPRRDAFQHHPRLATRTARALFFCLQPQRDFVLRIGV